MANTKQKTNEQPQGRVAFAAIDKYVESNIVSSKESTIVGHEFVSWGTNNIYPNYVSDLSHNVGTLKTLICGSAQYVCGNEVTSIIQGLEKAVNKKGETWSDFVENLARDYFTYGGFAINVVRNKDKKVSELYYLCLANLRSNKENTEFFYSEDWTKSYGRVKYAVYPKYNPESSDANSVFFYKNDYNRCYPAPIWEACVKAAETEKSIDDYHLNNIKNNFSGSYIVNFNNGQPQDDVRAQIEEDFNEKFTGEENAGNIMMTWNNSKDNETTIAKIDSEDFGAKYESLTKRTRQSLFTAFRATPNLFGIPTETTGFSEQEYDQAFKLFSRTQIRPIQNKIIDAVNYIFNTDNGITIKPFTLEGETETNVN